MMVFPRSVFTKIGIPPRGSAVVVLELLGDVVHLLMTIGGRGVLGSVLASWLAS